MNLANHPMSLSHLDPLCPAGPAPPASLPAWSYFTLKTNLIPKPLAFKQPRPIHEPTSKVNNKKIGEREEMSAVRGIHCLELVVSRRQEGSVLRPHRRQPRVAHNFPCSQARSAPAAFCVCLTLRTGACEPGCRCGANAMLARAHLCCPRRHGCSLAVLTRAAAMLSRWPWSHALLARWTCSPAHPPCSLAGHTHARAAAH
jgi:hypothetical protein